MKRKIIAISLSVVVTSILITGCESTVKQAQQDPVVQEVVEEPKNMSPEETLEETVNVAEANGDFAAQREALIALHKMHPSNEYIDAISKIPVEIQDPKVLQMVSDVFDGITDEGAADAISMLESSEFNAAFMDELVGVTKISIYNMGATIKPVAAAGVAATSGGLQLRVEANAFGVKIQMQKSTGEYKYLYYDKGGIVAFNTTIKDGNYDSDFKEIVFTSDGKVSELTKGTFDKGELTGTLTVTKGNKEYKADVTGKGYKTADVLGVEEYTDFTAFSKVKVEEKTLEDFEKELEAEITQKVEKAPTIVETHETVASVVKELKEDKSAASSSSSNKTGTSTSKTPSKTQQSTSTEEVYPWWLDNGGGNDNGGGGSAPAPAPDPTPAPAPEPAPEPPASDVEYEEPSTGTDFDY